MFDTLLSSDYMVDDPDVFAATIVDRLGLPNPEPEWRMALPNHAILPHFLRVHRDLRISPTMLEPVGYADVPNPRDPVFPQYLGSLELFQGKHRPMKSHGTVFTTSQMDELMERLQRRGVPFRLAPPSAEFPGDRIWIGCTAEHPDYDPSYDGGTMIEVIMSATISARLDRGPETAASPSTEFAEGSMVRVINRGFLVRDLDAVCALWAQNLGLEPSEVTAHEDEGYRRARYTFAVEESSTFDLICPTTTRSESGRFLSTWGPGPLYARIAVAGLDAKATDLKERDTPFLSVAATSAAPHRLSVDPAVVGGAIFEFVEHAD